MGGTAFLAGLEALTRSDFLQVPALGEKEQSLASARDIFTTTLHFVFPLFTHVCPVPAKLEDKDFQWR
jgi:hypothetical protein